MAYPCVSEAAWSGPTWARATRQPPLPDLEWLRAPRRRRTSSMHQRECNWLQAIEGDIDTSHFGFLHLRAHTIQTDASDYRAVPGTLASEVLDTDYGFTYAGVRHLAEEHQNYVLGVPVRSPLPPDARGGSGQSPQSPGGRPHVDAVRRHPHLGVQLGLPHGLGPIALESWLAQEHRMGRGPEDLLPGFRLKQSNGKRLPDRPGAPEVGPELLGHPA